MYSFAYFSAIKNFTAVVITTGMTIVSKSFNGELMILIIVLSIIIFDIKLHALLFLRPGRSLV